MLSIEEIKLTISTLKKLKKHQFDDFIDQYLRKLQQLALQVDAYNDDQIKQIDKPRDWYLKDLDWRDNRRDLVNDPLLEQMVQTKINFFAKAGKQSSVYHSLEIGPGYGKFSKMFTAWQLNFFLDLLPQCESKIKKKFHPPHHKYLRFYTTDRTNCAKVPTNSCNFVFSWDTFPFFSQLHIKDYLRSIYRVIVPGGYCFIHYADCHYEKDLHEAKRGYWNFNTKTEMKVLITECGYEVVEMDQFRPGANYAIFKKPGNLNPVLYSALEIPVEK